MQVLARTLRYLANRYLADPGRADRERATQHTARTNAAEASATLRQRRRDRDEVDAYLQSQAHVQGAVQAAPGQDGQLSGRAR